MSLWIIAFAASSAVSSIAFVAVAVMWLRKLRETLSKAITESAEQQLITAKQLGDTVTHLQKQQRTTEQQLHNLAQAGLKLRQELTAVSTRLEHTEVMQGDRTVH